MPQGKSHKPQATSHKGKASGCRPKAQGKYAPGRADGRYREFILGVKIPKSLTIMGLWKEACTYLSLFVIIWKQNEGGSQGWMRGLNAPFYRFRRRISLSPRLLVSLSPCLREQRMKPSPSLCGSSFIRICQACPAVAVCGEGGTDLRWHVTDQRCFIHPRDSLSNKQQKYYYIPAPKVKCFRPYYSHISAISSRGLVWTFAVTCSAGQRGPYGRTHKSRPRPPAIVV
jgi:hypothetical protein